MNSTAIPLRDYRNSLTSLLTSRWGSIFEIVLYTRCPLFLNWPRVRSFTAHVCNKGVAKSNILVKSDRGSQTTPFLRYDIAELTINNEYSLISSGVFVYRYPCMNKVSVRELSYNITQLKWPVVWTNWLKLTWLSQDLDRRMMKVMTYLTRSYTVASKGTEGH